jgi:hypothetical protein
MNQVTPIAEGSPNAMPRTKGDVFRILNQSIPQNQFHLPDHIYRADLVPEDVLNYSPKDRLLVLDSASLLISFDHGYPAVNGSAPMWEQMTGEPEDAYACYTAYLELPEKSNSDNPIRMLPMISTLTKIPLSTIVDWCHMFYWHWRSRAYDLFLVACHRQQRTQRMMSIEGAHFKFAEDMLAKVIKVASHKLDRDIKRLGEDNDADTEDKTKDLVDMAVKLVQVQRISVGLPANGIISGALQLDGPRHTTASETFKHIAKEGAGEDAPTARSQEMDALLESPDDLSKIQELMIKLHNPQNTLPVWGQGRVIMGTSNGADLPQDADSSDSNVEDLGYPDQP